MKLNKIKRGKYQIEGVWFGPINDKDTFDIYLKVKHIKKRVEYLSIRISDEVADLLLFGNIKLSSRMLEIGTNFESIKVILK